MTAADQEIERTNNTVKPTLAQLRERYPHAREAVLAALSILLEDESISAEHAKARAKELGVRITAASVSSAKRLLGQMDVPTASQPATTAPTAATRRTPRPRVAEPAKDAEALIKGV